MHFKPEMTIAHCFTYPFMQLTDSFVFLAIHTCTLHQFCFGSYLSSHLMYLFRYKACFTKVAITQLSLFNVFSSCLRATSLNEVLIQPCGIVYRLHMSLSNWKKEFIYELPYLGVLPSGKTRSEQWELKLQRKLHHLSWKKDTGERWRRDEKGHS